METEEVRFEIDKQGNLIIYVRDLLKKDSEEIRFAILKEHLDKLKEVIKSEELSN